MGINPMGSNKKYRATFVYESREALNVVKNILGDLGEVDRVSPSRELMGVVVGRVARERRTKAVAEAMYSKVQPDVLEGFALAFEWLAAYGEDGSDSSRLVRLFLDHAIEFGLMLDTTRSGELRMCWNRVIGHLEGMASADCPVAAEALKYARGHVSELGRPIAQLAVRPQVSTLESAWAYLRDDRSAYGVLAELARLSFPTRGEVFDPASRRLAILQALDCSRDEGQI